MFERISGNFPTSELTRAMAMTSLKGQEAAYRNSSELQERQRRRADQSSLFLQLEALDKPQASTKKQFFA